MLKKSTLPLAFSPLLVIYFLFVAPSKLVISAVSHLFILNQTEEAGLALMPPFLIFVVVVVVVLVMCVCICDQLQICLL